jgi:CDP-glucose 4,6-dehydratase
MEVGPSAVAKEPRVMASFWKDRRVLLTGHTGFKGGWAAVVLADRGAKVTGVSLAPATNPNLWPLIRNRLQIADEIADLRDAAAVSEICRSAQPEIVLHMAAQAQVRAAYHDPVGTFASNVMGSVNLLEALRATDTVKTILVVTSDKVYWNPDDGRSFAEHSPLGGNDPYSASKAAVEFVARSYSDSYFARRRVSIATARGGNVIGGGDFSSDRLVPDLYRAALARQSAELRFPDASRPWQHVLDCIDGYLVYIEHLSKAGVADPPALNFGPLPEETKTVAQLADAIGLRLGNGNAGRQATGEFPAEKQSLTLDITRALQTLNWRPRLSVAESIEWTAQWYADFTHGRDALALMRRQIDLFFANRSGVSAQHRT